MQARCVEMDQCGGRRLTSFGTSHHSLVKRWSKPGQTWGWIAVPTCLQSNLPGPTRSIQYTAMCTARSPSRPAVPLAQFGFSSDRSQSACLFRVLTILIHILLACCFAHNVAACLLLCSQRCMCAGSGRSVEPLGSVSIAPLSLALWCSAGLGADGRFSSCYACPLRLMPHALRART